MKTYLPLILLSLFLLCAGTALAAAAESPPQDPGWPRVIKKNGKELTIYQPQVDYWKNYKDLHVRCAIAVKTGKSAKEKFGVAEIDAETVTDHANRVVTLIPKKRDLRFPNTTEVEEETLRNVVGELHPPVAALTVSLDRVLAYLDPAQQPQQQAIELNLEPPKIFYSRKPAILVMFLGEPQLQPVVKDKNDLMFAVNTNWDLFYDTTKQRYYLLNGDNWLTATDAIKGPWTPTTDLPVGLSSLPADENWADVRQQVPGKKITNPPVVLVTTEPAELILTKGDPSYSPISGTKLMRVANTDSVVFLNSGDGKHYLLAAGRWFRAASLNGPWSAASSDLPADFARIPDSDPAAFVKASVPGTIEAKDAVLLASVPTTTVVNVADPAPVEISYSGEPKFQPIASTTVQYAVNSPSPVFLVNNSYYSCIEGAWFCSGSANGPWTYCTSVPAAIYTIPPTHPLYNVTYVTVENSTPTTVIYSQTAGYSGEYVASTGVLMFGAGMLAGAMIADHHDHYYYPPYPTLYSYGSGARYNYAHGGYYRAAHGAYGPYGGAGAAAAYNPRTGTYSRGAYAYGPAGSASVRQAYNPYTGTRASGARVSTPYGSAGRAAAYNPRTGAGAGAAKVDTAYGSAGRAAAYNPNTGTAARAGYRSNERGSAAAVQTNRGTGAAAWDTKSGQGAVVKGRQGNVYAGKDGNVYKKDTSGNWSSNTGGGWQSTNRPQSRQELNSQAQARSRGNQLSQQARGGTGSSWGGGGGSRGGGRGGRR